MQPTASAERQQALLAPNEEPAPATPGNPLGEFVRETLALTWRLFVQLRRRPSTLVAGVLQPLMWLVLFGALFERAPAGMLGGDVSYEQFLAPGIIVFTAFSGALNAGLPVMFDREFGFLNRLLVAPLASRYSIVAASTLYILSLSAIQTAAIVAASAALGAGLPGAAGLGAIMGVVLAIAAGITALSLGLAFALPGHVQLIAVIFVLNLPLLFASTALAPLAFMADWLQWVASLNPLTYAIAPIRYVYLNPDWAWGSAVLQAPWGEVTLASALAVLLGFAAAVSLAIQPLLRRRFA